MNGVLTPRQIAVLHAARQVARRQSLRCIDQPAGKQTRTLRDEQMLGEPADPQAAAEQARELWARLSFLAGPETSDEQFAAVVAEEHEPQLLDQLLDVIHQPYRRNLLIARLEELGGCRRRLEVMA